MTASSSSVMSAMSEQRVVERGDHAQGIAERLVRVLTRIWKKSLLRCSTDSGAR